MVRPSARYVGDAAGVLVPAFPESLNAEVRRLLPTRNSPDEIAEERAFAEGFGSDDWRQAHPSDNLVGALVSAAYKVKVGLDRRKRLSVSKPDLRAEYSDLLNCLEPTAQKLRSISLPLSRLLPIDADALDLAERIEKFAFQIREFEVQVVNSKDKETEEVFRGHLATLLARDVIDILQGDGLSVAAGVSARGKPSLLVAILKTLGDAAGLYGENNTWKHAVLRVRKAK